MDVQLDTWLCLGPLIIAAAQTISTAEDHAVQGQDWDHATRLPTPPPSTPLPLPLPLLRMMVAVMMAVMVLALSGRSAAVAASECVAMHAGSALLLDSQRWTVSEASSVQWRR